MSEEPEILPVELHLPGLLKVLGDHLYSDPRVAIRELVQNAHDSCMRRREEDTSAAVDYEPQIRVLTDSVAQQLVIEDNGSGLTHDEITVFLATVGRGYTRELREKLGSAQREEALELIGMFGLGLLSSFMIASRVEITTMSYQSADSAWRWTSEGGQSYALRKATRSSVGTTVRLSLREDAKFLLDPNILRETLRGYVEFLPIPIKVNDDETAVNDYPAPWMDDVDAGPGRNAHYASWVETRLKTRPLTVLPLEDIKLADGRVLPLRGVLYVPQTSIISIREYGDVSVYVRHMLITARERDLLPDWARFVSGVVDCPVLNPTASRESLQHDEIYLIVREALSRMLLEHFEYLALHAPFDWREIVQAHNDLIKGWAIRAPELFMYVADLVNFKTSRGELTLPDYLRENPGRIYYYDNEDGITQALALFEARRLAVVDARWFADTAFLKAYGSVYGVPVEELTPAASYLFAPVDDPEQIWQPLVAACRAEGLPVRLLSFEPEHLPMILLYPPGAERVRRAQHHMDDGRFVGPIRSLVRGFLNRQQIDETVIKGVLHLNVRNPLLRRIRDMGLEHPNFSALLGILIANARIFAGQNISAQEAIACFEQINDSLAQIAGIAAPTQNGQLTTSMLTELGLSPDAARRLCTECETVEDLLNANVQTLAERVRISPLLLATLCEELKNQAQISNHRESEQTIAQPQRNIIMIGDARAQKSAHEPNEGGDTDGE